MRDTRKGTPRKFYEWLKINRIGNEATRRLYVMVVARFLREYPKQEIEGFNQFISNYGHEEKRSYYCRSALRHYLDMTGRGDEKKEIKKIKILDPKKVRQYYGKNIIRGIIDNIEDDNFRLVAEIQYRTGCRASEALKINSDDIMPDLNDDNGMIRVKLKLKGGKTVVVPIGYGNDPVCRDIIELRRMGQSLFRKGEIKHKTFYNRYGIAIKEASELPFTSHDFRSDYAKDVWNMEKNILMVKEALRHKKIETTLRYIGDVHVDREKILKELRLKRES